MKIIGKEIMKVKAKERKIEHFDKYTYLGSMFKQGTGAVVQRLRQGKP